MSFILRIYNSIKRNKYLEIVISGLILLSISVFINFLSFKVFDYDGFYHIRHAWVYRTHGLFDTSLPWVQYSVINSIGGDLWYGFHILMIPFTYFKDLVYGIKLAGALIAFGALFLYYFTCVRLKLKFPLIWAILLPASSLYMMARFMVTRPHPLSLGLNMLLFSYLISGASFPVFIISFFISFIHINLAWIPILTLIAIVFAKKINGLKIEINKALALSGGLLAGVFLRPQPIATLKLTYIQLVDIILVKMSGFKLSFGSELYPLPLSNLSFFIMPFFIAMVLFSIWLIYKKNLSETQIKNKIAIWVSIIFSMFFLILGIFVAARSMEYFLAYLFVLTGLNVTFFIENIKNRSQKRAIGAILIIFISIILFDNLKSWTDFRAHMDTLSDPYRYERSSMWLEDNSKPGDIVFHLGWDNFGELFFWNQKDYYINGMDPIFMYKYNPKLYWEFHFLDKDTSGELTCPNNKCTKDQAVKTYDVLVNDFKASFVFVNAGFHPNAYKYFIENPDKFKLGYYGDGVGVFRIVK